MQAFTLTVNIKVKRFFCTSGHIVGHAHVPSCVRHLSCQYLEVGEKKRGFFQCEYVLIYVLFIYFTLNN